MSRKAVVVGAGFGGLASAALLAKQGWDVTVVEKNDQVGGRARYWQSDGFSFDMGPSWYLMPEAFDGFFHELGENRADYYQLKRLDPSYRIYFESSPPVDIGADFAKTRAVFDSFESGGGSKLDRYMEETAYKYKVAVGEFLYRDYTSLFEFFNKRLIIEGLKLQVFRKLDGYLKGFFKDHRSRKVLEFPMVFLGASPTNAPALYSIMSHLDINQGVWYPEGGMAGAALGFRRVAEKLRVSFDMGSGADKITVEKGRATRVNVNSHSHDADLVLVNADYHHAETALLDKKWRSYSQGYWNRKVLGPSMLLGFIGIKGKLDNIRHHSLYFADDWNRHFRSIFNKPAWPANPCYYVCCNSQTDPMAAPEGHDNLFFLVPLAAGLDDRDEIREPYFDQVLHHFEGLIGQNIRDRIVVKRLYSGREFTQDYNAYKGAALGIAHTLRQTAVFRPSLRSRKVKNLFYSGQYTHPGVGVPMSVIAAQVVAGVIRQDHA